MSYTKIGTEWRGYYITAYGIAVKHGFIGTEEEWLASLKGDGGEPVVIRYSETDGQLQWKYENEDDSAWREILTLADLQGDLVSATISQAQAAKTAAEAAKTAAQAAASSAQTDASTAQTAAATASTKAAAAAASYDEFQRELTNSGLGSEFSSADLKLAQQNPDAGMSILKYKRDYHNATTPEQRALANLGAEGIRSSYGNYTGGGAGSQFYLDPLSPNSFQQDAKPTYSSNRTGLVDDLLNKQLNYGNYSYDVAQPEYTNRYDETIQDLLKQILNREAFSYDPERDQLYSQYRKQYTREGDRAQQNAIGAAAAASGGIPSSYAATAAAQAGDYYAAQMTDKIPELYQLAYNKYMNDYNMKLGDLGAVQGAEQSDYDKYLNELQQYNTNRNFDYQTCSAPPVSHFCA